MELLCAFASSNLLLAGDFLRHLARNGFQMLVARVIDNPHGSDLKLGEDIPWGGMWL